MGIAMGTCKKKAIQEDSSISAHILTCSGILRHNQAYPETIQAYLGIIRTLCNPGIFRNLTCLVLIFPLEKNVSRGEQVLEGMNFCTPWNFVKEQVLHNFMKYFSEA